MRIGLISDTHGRLHPGVFEHFEDVDRILHAGDVGDPAILDELSAIAPVDAVWGNTDGFAVRAVTRETVELEAGGLKIAMSHGHRVAEFGRLVARFPAAEVIVHGHSHVPRFDLVAGVRFVNPGSAGPGGSGWSPSVAVAEADEGRIVVVHRELATGRVLKL